MMKVNLYVEISNNVKVAIFWDRVPCCRHLLPLSIIKSSEYRPCLPYIGLCYLNMRLQTKLSMSLHTYANTKLFHYYQIHKVLPLTPNKLRQNIYTQNIFLSIIHSFNLSISFFRGCYICIVQVPDN